MMNLMKKNKYLLLLLVALASICVLFLLPYWLSNRPFAYVGDIQTQWFPFYNEIRRLLLSFLKEGNLPFYSWTAFLGNNYWASKSYYGLFDIFNYLTFFTNLQFFDAHQLLTVLKLMVGGVSFYFYLKKIDVHSKVAVLLSVCYAFSSWAIFFTGQSTFLSFYCLMPLYFLGMEECLNNKVSWIFCLSTAILLFANYYFFYTISFFSPVYFLYRYYNLNGDFKGVVLCTAKCIGIYTVGVFITGIMTLPTLSYMMQNDRIGSATISLVYDNLIVYLHQLASMFSPSHTYIYNSNVFETGEHISREICAWAGTVTALLTPQFVTDSNKKYRYSTALIYLFFLLMLTPIGSSIFHGFSEYSFRWLMLVIFMNLGVAGRYLSDVNRIHHQNLKITACSASIVLVFTYFVAFLINHQGHELSFFVPQFVVGGISIVLLIIFTVILTKKTILWLLVCLTFIEVAGYTFYNIGFLQYKQSYGQDFINEVSSVLGDAESINHYLNGLEESNYSEFYRVYVPVDSIYWNYSHNWNMTYQLKGLTTYDSTYSPSINDLKTINWSQVTWNECGWMYDIKDSNIMSYLATKYAITMTEDEIPFRSYEIVDSYSGLLISKNLDYQLFGKTFHQLMTYDEYINVYKKDTSIFLDTLLVHENQIEELSQLINPSCHQAVMEGVVYGGNSLTGYVTSEDNSFLVMALPYDSGWNILVNGNDVSVYSVGGGMIGIPIESGINSIEMYFVPSGLKLGAMMSGLGVIGFFLLLLISKKETIS